MLLLFLRRFSHALGRSRNGHAGDDWICCGLTRGRSRGCRRVLQAGAGRLSLHRYRRYYGGRRGRSRRLGCGRFLRVHPAMLLPVREDQLARVFRGIAHGVRGARAQHVARLVGHLHLAIAAQQATILLRLTIQHDRVIGIRLVQRHGHGAVLLQIFSHFHALVVRIDRRARSPRSPMLAAAPAACAGHVLRTLSLHKHARLLLRSRRDNQTYDDCQPELCHEAPRRGVSLHSLAGSNDRSLPVRRSCFRLRVGPDVIGNPTLLSSHTCDPALAASLPSK